MMRLILMRHAKSDWNQPGLSDFERPLSRRGVKDARKMGKWMGAQIEPPEIILCSSARRTQQTEALFLLGLTASEADTQDIELTEYEEMYLASTSTLIKLAKTALNQYESVMLIAHNPGMDGILMHYCPDSPLSDNGKLMTTANIAVIEFDDLFNPSLLFLQRPKDI